MVRNITRCKRSREQREHFQQFVDDTQPSDDQQIDCLRNQFPNFHLPQIFQLFEIFHSRRHNQQLNFETLINFARCRNIRNERNAEQIMNATNNSGNQLPQPAMIFVDDPFKGNINPGTSDGAKLYIKVTTELDEDDKYEINIENAQKFLDQMTRETNNYGWRALVRNIQVDANTIKSMLNDHKDITQADMKR